MIPFFGNIGNFFNRSVKAIRTRVKRTRFQDIRLDSNIRPATLRAIRQESIRLYNENALARSMIDILTTNVVGSGLRLSLSLNGIDDLKENADELEKEILESWHIWSRNRRSDYSEITDFQDLQQQAYLGRLIQGEIFSIQRYEEEFTVQLVEAHRTAFIGSVGGFADIEKEQGIKYTVKGQERQFTFDDVLHIDAKTADGRQQVIHYFKQERPGQMRGIPRLTPAFKDLKDLDQYTEYEIKAAIIAASLTAFVKSEKADPLGTGPLAEEATEQDPNYEPDKDYALKPGAIFALDPGEDIVAINPARPSTSFKIFYDTVVRNLGASMGVPFNILIKQFDTSYTAARAAVLEFWKTVMVDRNHFSRRFCQPNFEQWLRFQVIKGRIKIQGYLDNQELRDRVNNSSTWIGNAMPQMDEGRAVKAANERIAGGLSTREIETSLRDNGDFFSNADKLGKEEIALGIKAPEGTNNNAQ